MKFIFSLLVYAGLASAQLSTPVLEGKCLAGDHSVIVHLQDGLHSLHVLKGKKSIKKCAIDLTDSSLLSRGNLQRVNLYYRLSACDRRLSSEKSFDPSPLKKTGLLVIESHPPKISGIASLFTNAKGETKCSYQGKSWEKVVKLGEKSAKKIHR